MSYLIAVATSDGNTVNQHFGEAHSYSIYEADGLKYNLLQKRDCVIEKNEELANSGGCCAQGLAKVQLLKDCRCIVAVRVGFKMQKEFSRLGISVFDDLECSVDEALKEITEYFYKTDNHIAQNKL